MSRTVYDFDDASDRALAGLTLAGVVNSEAWPVIRQLATHLREKAITKLPEDVVALAGLNGKQAGMTELLTAIEVYARAVVTEKKPDKDTVVAAILAQRTSLPGGGPV